ncbi:armadillo-type protein [Mycena galopus ATCC 62051]|nr:armadillo-type protein [Mycena galopus ATCC 62051]
MPPLTRQGTDHSWWSDSNSVLKYGPTINIHAAAKPLIKLMYHQQVLSFFKKYSRYSTLGRKPGDLWKLPRVRYLSVLLGPADQSYRYKYLASATRSVILSELDRRVESVDEADRVVNSVVFDQLMDLMKADNANVRRSTCWVVGGLAMHESTAVAVLGLHPCQRLVALLRDPNVQVIKAAIYAICQIAQWQDGTNAAIDAKILDHLMQFLGLPDSNVRALTLWTFTGLAMHSPMAVLGSDNPDIVVGLLARSVEKIDPILTKAVAQALLCLSSHLSNVGRHEDAVHADEEAVALHRKLAETDPSITKDLGDSLQSLGVHLCDVGRHEEAVHADEEAVELHRKLAKTDPSITKDLATSLQNLGVHLYNVGHHEDAVHPDEEAVVLHHPSITKGLGFTLQSLGIHRNVGLHKDAMGAAKEAVALWRKLAETNPSITKDLAESLHSLGIYLYNLGHHEDAVGAAEEAVVLRRKLVETDPSIAKDLAASLQNLGIYLYNVDCDEDAVGAAKEAVALNHKLAGTDPSIAERKPGFAEALIKSLASLARYLHALGREEEAALPVEVHVTSEEPVELDEVAIKAPTF